MRPRLLLALLPALAAAACSSSDNPAETATSSGVGGATSSSGSGDASSSGTGGAGAQGGAGGQGGTPEPDGPIRYPHGLRHSPLSKTVVTRLAPVLAASTGRPGVFAKVGDSNTVNTGFLNCFSGNDVKLDTHAGLEPTRAFFAKTLADDSHTSFNRTTLAAKVGWSTGAVLAGNPSPIAQEVAAIAPGFAVVMLGTNDTYPQGVEPFSQNLLAVVDDLLGRGVVPLLTTIPPRADTAEAAALVPEMNAIVRAVAQARQVPMMDLEGTLDPIPGYGLTNDGVHLQIYASNGVAHPCWFDAAALSEGMNQRNLITLEALDRMRRYVLEGAPPESRPADLKGEGSWQSPFEIDSLPFVDDRDTTKSNVSVANVYSCSAADESGPEVVYRLSLSKLTQFRIHVLDGAGVDVDVHLMNDPGGADQCIARADKQLDASLGPGTYWISVDTYVSAGNPQPGPYLLTVTELP
jgi:hypothetical protein